MKRYSAGPAGMLETDIGTWVEYEDVRREIERLVADNANLRLSWQLTIKERDKLRDQVLELRAQKQRLMNGDRY